MFTQKLRRKVAYRLTACLAYRRRFPVLIKHASSTRSECWPTVAVDATTLRYPDRAIPESDFIKIISDSPKFRGRESLQPNAVSWRGWKVICFFFLIYTIHHLFVTGYVRYEEYHYPREPRKQRRTSAQPLIQREAEQAGSESHRARFNHWAQWTDFMEKF